MSRLVVSCVFSLLALAVGGPSEMAANASTPVTMPDTRYVDPSQLDLPEPYYSFVRQPWRSYLESTPATRYTEGLGVVWNSEVPGRGDDEVARDLAWAGFRRVRLELPWSAMRWDEEGLTPETAARVPALLRAFRTHGLRPDILLNANHGAPGPMQVRTWQTARASPAGSREVSVQGPLEGIEPGWSEILSLGDSARAGPLVTRVTSDGTLILSRPSDRDLPAGAVLRIGRLKYLPLFPVADAEFERTTAGWLRYVDCIVRLVVDNYGPDFDLEIWNELTFGSDFLDINHYYEPPLIQAGPEFLHAGGAAWELARRTVTEVKRLDAGVRIIWGFSNTTFFHTAVRDLPPGIDAQSYHPYGTGPRCYAKLVAGRERYNVGNFVPNGCALMPEGWAQSFQQTETLMRILNPPARAAHPPGVMRFEHFMTEHGLSAREIGITDPRAADRARAKFLLRAPLFWLNKGISAIYDYDLYDPDELGFGLLHVDGTISPAMRALRRTVEKFAGSRPLARPMGIDAHVARLSGPGAVYANDPLGKHVQQQETATVLPFQVSDHRLIVGLYVMAENFPMDLPPQGYRITLDGVSGRGARLQYYDPLTDASQQVRTLEAGPDRLSVALTLTDTPRLLEITEQ